MWDHDQRVRLLLEEGILKQELPCFMWEDRIQRGETKVIGDYISSGGNSYKICLKISSNYPYEMPNLYIISPYILYGYAGKTIQSYGTSHAMHVWVPDWNNYVKICHCKSEYWSASKTIVTVLMNGMLWLEGFEAHRRTGKVIDSFSLTYS